MNMDFLEQITHGTAAVVAATDTVYGPVANNPQPLSSLPSC
jgi:hypothetical protein